RFNRMERCRGGSVGVLANNLTPGLDRTEIYQNVIVDALFGLLPRNFAERTPADFDFFNNTVVNPTDSFVMMWNPVGANGVKINRNLVVGGPRAHNYAEFSGDALAEFKARGYD